MKVWSKGLGRIVLTMDLRKYYVELEPGDDGVLYIKGKITDPVFWNFRITINKDDIPGLVKILLNPKLLIFILTNFHRIFQLMFEKIFRKEKFLPET